jgi:hypothetical protein
MKSLKILSLFFFILTTQNFAFAETRIGGHLGFESLTAGGDTDLAGLSMGGLIQGAFLSTSQTAVLAGGRLNYINLSGDQNNVDISWSQFLIGAEVGFEYKATSELFIQSVVGYDLGMTGTTEVKSNGIKREDDTKGIGRIIHDWRVLYEVNPKFIVGGNVGWFAGPFESKEIYKTDLSTRGFDIRGVAYYQF